MQKMEYSAPVYSLLVPSQWALTGIKDNPKTLLPIFPRVSDWATNKHLFHDAPLESATIYSRDWGSYLKPWSESSPISCYSSRVAADLYGHERNIRLFLYPGWLTAGPLLTWSDTLNWKYI